MEGLRISKCRGLGSPKCRSLALPSGGVYDFIVEGFRISKLGGGQDFPMWGLGFQSEGFMISRGLAFLGFRVYGLCNRILAR